VIRAILRKEWREHRFTFAAYVALMGFLLLVQYAANEATLSAGNAFDLVRRQCYLVAFGGALLISHRLIVREYGQKTQLFLETLPVTRTRLLVFKLVFGAGIVLLPIALAIAFAAYLVSQHELLTARHVVLVSTRAALAVSVSWTLMVLAGLVGRYRNPLLLSLVVGLFVLDSSTSFEVSELNALLLLGDDFAYARTQLPWKGVLACVGLSAAFVALSFALVLYRDGTVAELLSDRMSHREKVFIACGLVGFFFVGTVLEDEKAKEPFRLHEGISATKGGTVVQVAPAEGFARPQAQALGDQVVQDVAGLSAYLGAGDPPPVSLLPARELDEDVFERAELTDKDGLLLRANFGESFDARQFRAFLARELIDWTSNGHALREERRWLRDGFAVHWAYRDEADFAQLELRAAYAAHRFSPEKAPEWLTVSEELGPCLSDAVAWVGTRVIRQRLGEDGFAAFVRSTLGGRPPRGLRGLFVTGSLRSQLEARGLPWPELVTLWSKALEDARRRQAEPLQATRQASAELWLDRDSPVTFSVRHALTTQPPPADALRYTFLAKRLGAFDAEVSPEDFERFSAVASGPVRAPRSFSRGERWLWAVEVFDPALGCTVRVHRERRELW
jgi:hypothetical protein